MSIFRNNSSKKPWWIILLGMLTSIMLVFTGTVGASTTAQASQSGPSITVTGKGCPKTGSSSWNRKMKIGDKAKANSTICTVKTNDGQYGGLNLNAKYTFKKNNDYRFDAYVKMTGHTSVHHVSRDGLQEWWFTADAWSVKLSGQETQYPDEHGTVWFYKVPGKAFTIKVTWTVKEKVRYWSNSLAQFVTETKKYDVSMKTVKFTSVTKTQ